MERDVNERPADSRLNDHDVAVLPFSLPFLAQGITHAPSI